MEKLIQTVYTLVVVGNQKALVAFAVPSIIGAIAFTGITGDMTVSQAIGLLLTSAITGISVFLKRNQ